MTALKYTIVFTLKCCLLMLFDEGVSVTTHTYDCIQSEGTLSEDLFVACHCRSLLTSFPVQVS